MNGVRLGGDAARAWQIGRRRARERTVVLLRGRVLVTEAASPTATELAGLLEELTARGLRQHQAMALEGFRAQWRELQLERDDNYVS